MMDDRDARYLAGEMDGGPSASTAEGLQAELAWLREEVRRLRSALPAPPFVEAPAIEDRSEILPRSPSESYERRSLADIERLVIHHSALPAEIGPETIAGFQVRQRGWPAIGYHYFITAEGAIIQTNPLETIAFHTRVGNETSVGVCLAGRFLDDALPTSAQLDAAAALCAYLCGRFGLHARAGGIVGHGELVDVECPGSQWNEGVRWREELLRRVEELQAAAGRRRQRAIGHYLLFWQEAGRWDEPAWEAARRYIARFQPICGFSIETASQAEYVTIVGDESRFPPAVEAHLQEAGCIVERISESDPDRLRQLFERMVEQDLRFLSVGL